jgi:poly-gamma-glutamate capsule biosynthesis protein CapA/YwtB (metallophosphatase superfamily)/UDP-N-acetylmuramyl pentapeptide synthase
MPITIDAQQIALASGGSWEGGISNQERFDSVSVLANASEGSLCVLVDNSSRWVKAEAKPPTKTKILQAVSRGVKAFVVGKDFAHDISHPILRVANTWDALSDIANANRDASKAKRILVTGSVGKTNYKLMAHHAFTSLTNIHAIPGSANLNVPIWCSLASIGESDTLSIVEVSVANPNRGWQRSALIQPHFCVITNISSSHTSFHGSVENLIRAKAESVTSLQEGGLVLMSTDHPYFLALKEEVQKIRPVPILTWGREEFCDARLISSHYDTPNACWIVCAKVMGSLINYKIGTHHSFAPIASLGVLLTAAVTGIDVQKAAGRLVDFLPGESTGCIYDVATDSGSIKLFDYSQRGSIEGFRAALADLYRLTPNDRRIVMALGESRDLSDEDTIMVHEEIAHLVQTDRTSKLFTVGEGMKILRSTLTQSNILAQHGNEPEDIQGELLASIRPGDALFIQGHHRVWMSRIVNAMKRKWQFTPSLSAHSPKVNSLSPEATYTFLAAGDTILARDFPGRMLDEGSDWVLGSLTQTFHKADGVLLNLETVISQKGEFNSKISERRPFHYRTPQFVTEALQKMGATILATANNHSMDFGAEALKDQISLFDRMNMPYAGSGNSVQEARQWKLLQCGEARIAIIAFDTTAPWAAATTSTAGTFHLPLAADSASELLPIIREAKQFAHIVIVTPHWGANWAEQPKQETIAFAHAIIDAGADIILGHSSHLVHGIERYNGRAIVYDMGTFISDRVGQSRMNDGAFFELQLSRQGIHGLLVHPIYLRRCRARKARNASARILGLVKRLSLQLNTVLIDNEDSLLLELTPGRNDPAELPDVLTPRVFMKDHIQFLSQEELKSYEPEPVTPMGNILNMGGGLEIGAYRHAEAIAPGYSFVFELRFRCLQQQTNRWRSELSFIAEDGSKTILRYPVADGLWHHRFSGSSRWYKDLTLVRTPSELTEGRYRLLWNLWSKDADNKVIHWQTANPTELAVSQGVFVGMLEISQSAEKGISGIDLCQELPFCAPAIE